MAKSRINSPANMKLAALIGVKIVGAVLICQIFDGCNYREEKGPKNGAPLRPEFAAKVSYPEVFAKVFQPHCIACHGSSGGVNLETYASSLSQLEKIRQEVFVDFSMPKSPYAPLNDRESELLAAWIQAGGPNITVDDGTTTGPIQLLEARFDSIQRNVLAVKCLVCHSAGGKAERVPLISRDDLINSPLDIVIPGNAAESGLILVIQEGARKKMPPPESKIEPVKPDEIKIIEEWITNGAKN